MKESIDNALNVFAKLDFRKNRKQVEEQIEKAGNNVAVLDRDFKTAINDFAREEEFQDVAELTDQIESAELPDDNEISKLSQADIIVGKEDTQEIESRAMGGPVEENQPVIVGDNPDGSLNETSELFVPEQSGTIIPNDELVAQGENIEGMSDNLELGSITPKRTRSGVGANYITSISSSKQDSFSSNETESLIAGVNSNNIVPVVKNRETLSRSRGKSRRSTIMIVEKQMPVESNVTHSTKKSMNTRISSKTMSATLHDLQSVGVLKYT